MLFDEAGCTFAVLLQRNMEVAAAFKVDGTPMSYLVNHDGTIASELAAGVQATLILAGEMAPTNVAENESLNLASTGTRLVRDGLKTGEAAPMFRLPLLEGGEVSLLEYRGRPLVLVFSDPECAPCNDLAPRLVDAHGRSPQPEILMVSRGDLEANRAMVAEHGFGFPVALQRHWEISAQYGIFAAPVAFYVDEWGVVAAEVAVGPDAIIDLIARAIEGKEEASRA
jgi:peroxiredoxin